MLDAGARAATIHPAEGRLVIALSLPARAFAAVLAGAAAVTAAFRDNPPGTDAAEHFDYLAALPEGTRISHRRENSVEHGRLIGAEIDPNDATPRVRVELRNENTLLPVALSPRVQVTEDTGRLKGRKQKLIKEPEFLARALPGIDVTSLSAMTRLDCVIVGVQHHLHGELTALEFAARDDAAIHEGSLQSIVRARDVAGTGGAYRAAVVPASSDDGDAPVSASTPRVAIFDGARAFTNWRSRWRDSNGLVLIDRGLPSAEDGAAAVNQGYATRLADSDALADADVPAGIEVLAYVERR